MARESAWGEVPFAPVQSTLSHGFPGKRAAFPRNVLPVKSVQPLALGKGTSWRSPLIKTTLISVGWATIAPWRPPCRPGKMAGVGTPIDTHVRPWLVERKTPLKDPELSTAAYTTFPRMLLCTDKRMRLDVARPLIPELTAVHVRPPSTLRYTPACEPAPANDGRPA